MLIKSVTILCLVALAYTATIQKRDIPVEIIYEEPSSHENSVKNLDAKVQLSAKELKESTNELIEDPVEKPEDTGTPVEKAVNAVQNLDEKVQLSPDELGQALKHIPIQETVEEAPSLTKLEDKEEQVTQEPNAPSVEGVLQQAEELISNGLKKLRISFKPDNDQQGPNSEQWENLEKAVNEYLSEQKVKLQLKQEQPAQPGQPPQNQNFFQTIATGFQTIANNFLQNISGNQTISTNTTNQGDEQQGGGSQGGFQGFVSFFQGGVNNIVNSVNNLGGQGSTTSNTVLGDTGTGTTPAPGFITSFVSNVQQFFGQIQGGSQIGSTSESQGDTGVNNTASGPQGPVQVIQSIGSAINQFIQGNRPPGTSGDEGTATTEANIIETIGNAIQNSPLNPFRPTQTQKPSEPVATSQNPIQAGISGIQNVGNQIQQLVSGEISSTESAKQPEDQIAVEQNNQVVEELPDTKSGNVKEIMEESAGTVKEEMREKIKEEAMEEEIKQEEIKEEMKQEDMREEIKQEKIKQEEVKQEQIKQEEIKQEEIKQEEIKEEVKEEINKDDKNDEILMTAE